MPHVHAEHERAEFLFAVQGKPEVQKSGQSLDSQFCAETNTSYPMPPSNKLVYRYYVLAAFGRKAKNSVIPK